MRSLERHRDVGAYALGVLDEADAFRFEDHLVECPQCTARATEFGPTARQLMLFRQATPQFVPPLAEPGPRLLERLLGEIGVRRRANRRRFLYGLAASVVLAVAGSALALQLGSSAAPEARVTAATDPSTGVWAQVTAEGADWGSGLSVQVRDSSGPHSCRLFVVGRDGSEQAVGGWSVGAHESGTTSTTAGSSMSPDDIDHYDVRTSDGQRLVTLPAR
ncbi:zf-HC2 domain-containing protein [Streptomyces sp. NPDC026659]|uniref:zf-HC2 domain-containing protein n=1 Tax=Streptomyces sp. NPDC026659 TaxID=3155123 RepID=UPI0034062EBE